MGLCSVLPHSLTIDPLYIKNCLLIQKLPKKNGSRPMKFFCSVIVHNMSMCKLLFVEIYVTDFYFFNFISTSLYKKIQEILIIHIEHALLCLYQYELFTSVHHSNIPSRPFWLLWVLFQEDYNVLNLYFLKLFSRCNWSNQWFRSKTTSLAKTGRQES